MNHPNQEVYQYQLTTSNNINPNNLHLIPKSNGRGYTMHYTYPNQIITSFKLLTPFLDVHKISTKTFIKLHIVEHPSIQTIFETMASEILSKHPTFTLETIKFPISKAGHLIINLSQNATIHINQNKAKGSLILTTASPQFIQQFKMTAPILFFNSYSKRLDPNIQNDNSIASEKKLYYKGKFILNFNVTFNENVAFINAYAEEVELKYNVSKGGALIKSIEFIKTPIELATSISI